MADDDPSRRSRQPWKSARTSATRVWLASSDRSRVPDLVAGVAEAFEGITTEAFEEMVREFFDTATHPTLGVPYTQTRVPPHARAARPAARQRLPRLHLHRRRSGLRPSHLRGGLRHHTRSRDRLGEHGSSTATVTSTARRESSCPSTTAPASRSTSGGGLGASRCSPAATPTVTPRCCEIARFPLLIRHDDAEREFAYDEKAEKVQAAATAGGWTIASMKDDFARVF